MRNYYESTRQELYAEKLKINNELDRINHALSFMEVAEHNMKEMLWNRYELFKKETGKILVVEYLGGNSCNPACYKYYESDEIKEKINESEITRDYLLWLNNNQHYLDAVFNWL